MGDDNNRQRVEKARAKYDSRVETNRRRGRTENSARSSRVTTEKKRVDVAQRRSGLVGAVAAQKSALAAITPDPPGIFWRRCAPYWRYVCVVYASLQCMHQSTTRRGPCNAKSPANLNGNMAKLPPERGEVQSWNAPAGRRALALYFRGHISIPNRAWIRREGVCINAPSSLSRAATKRRICVRFTHAYKGLTQQQRARDRASLIPSAVLVIVRHVLE